MVLLVVWRRTAIASNDNEPASLRRQVTIEQSLVEKNRSFYMNDMLNLFFVWCKPYVSIVLKLSSTKPSAIEISGVLCRVVVGLRYTFTSRQLVW